MVVFLTHWSMPKRMKVPPSMMKPAGKMALTPQMERYLPTRGPAEYQVVGGETLRVSPNMKRDK